MERNIVIAVDAMGGDNAPYEIVKGAAEAVKLYPVKVLLVGQEAIVKKELSAYTYDEDSIEVVNADEVISTEEVPTEAVRKKRNSSMMVGLGLVKEKKAMAFISAGSTGALFVGGTITVGRIKGIERPALGTCLPTLNGYTLLLDSGANADCKPQYLVQFAKMGSVYAETVLGMKNPTVGLANIGVEKEKGNMLVKEVYELLENAEGINFIGNAEMVDIPFGVSNVVVCDGFVGNTILKTLEGQSKALLKRIKSEITKGPYKIAAAALKTPFDNIKKSYDSDQIGGAPYIGFKALVMKVHGSCKAPAIVNCIKQSIDFIENGTVEKIEKLIQE
ncbi:MAG: phosphate acyltransferase PlsX [Clostridia bacterium]|nr:phosphate acyltransferase PlsX [Clostridia bacterium]